MEHGNETVEGWAEHGNETVEGWVEHGNETVEGWVEHGNETVGLNPIPVFSFSLFTTCNDCYWGVSLATGEFPLLHRTSMYKKVFFSSSADYHGCSTDY